MPWLALVAAGCLEVLGVINLKRLAMKKWDAALYLIITFGIGFVLLSYAMKTIPMGTAYGVWTGIGTIGAALVGMFMYGEPKEWRRLLFIAMILCSAVGLKLIG
ncbi:MULTISPECIES: DMT family transporter [Paenibacillus]|jgi:paired small multidrug resistance pump|uniref:Multidrug efflux SMR transporter n=1 Tax=Paenibacillus baimaensis TaxID=2982185 RepID=A0ABT2UT26_9BACL|nr:MULTISPECIES: multidrug efflux SMR transporter [Paenibacillus]MCU6797789.1 multidrug efflux SMR transporter [Paenibacillus sp. WQ 127069]OMF20077.1 QacE family quaternary ammonium compound efflux SMR transporter [Paenibacillus sp. FSL H7-0331]